MCKDEISTMSDTTYRNKLRELEQLYLEALQDFDLNDLFEDQDLSGLFLPKPDESFFSSNCKVMIIGQETKSWRNAKCEAKNLKYVDVDTIRRSMDSSLEVNAKKAGRCKFRQFYKKTSKILCKDSTNPSNSALWSNQFCISYKSASPLKSEKFEMIKSLSSKLLQAQFEILKPDVAIFTVGSSRDKYIKDSFKCEASNVIEPRRLWRFRITNTDCFRTNHPRSSVSKLSLKKAIELARIYT
jgi:hypothetical protein